MQPGADQPDDDVLLCRVGAGDHQAFEILLRRRLPGLLLLAERMLGAGRRADAEEVVQEAFLRVWQKADGWTARAGGAGAWLRRIVVNLCLDRLRRPVPLGLDQIAEPAALALSADRLVHGAEIGRAVTQALLRLPDRQRMAIVLCHCEGIDHAEAARLMSTTIGALETLLARGRKALRSRLTGLLQPWDGELV